MACGQHEFGWRRSHWKARDRVSIPAVESRGAHAALARDTLGGAELSACRRPASVHKRQATFTPTTDDVEVREPRCRICRDEAVRVAVNELLNWRGVPVFRQGGKSRTITLTDILAQLEPLNEGREKGDRITYTALWNHFQRHYRLAGVAAYWRARTYKDTMKALGG